MDDTKAAILSVFEGFLVYLPTMPCVAPCFCLRRRIAAKAIYVLVIDCALVSPQLLFCLLVRKMPPLTRCEEVSSSLYPMNEEASEKVKILALYTTFDI